MGYIISKSQAPPISEISLSSSKSISNRLLIMSALSEGKMKISNLSDSDDTHIMLELLASKGREKNVGHAGTAMRFLIAYYAIQDNDITLTGTDRMKNRPVAELVLKLRELGAVIDYLEKPGYPPIRIQGKDLKAKRLRIDSGISSQYISALMMIGPYLEGGLELMLTGETISASYIGLTAGLMHRAGINITWNENLIRIGEGEYKEGQYSVEPDWSAASYWFAITGLYEGSCILLKGLKPGSLQGDARLVDIFNGFGVKSEFTEDGLQIQHDGSGKDVFNCDFSDNPDLVQTLIPYCVAKETAFSFTGCRTLRIKETDRVLALYTEMKKFGVDLQFSDNGDQISWDRARKPVWKRNIIVESYNDHRMAMGFAPLAIKTNELEILDPLVVTKSYPGFWADIVKAGFKLRERE